MGRNGDLGMWRQGDELAEVAAPEPSNEAPADESLEHGIPVIGTPLVQEAARWEAHIKLGHPYRTSYEARMRHYLALCAKVGIRAKAIPLVTAFRYGYWEAAGDPIAFDQQEMALELQIRKQTFGQLVRLACIAWEGIERDDSCRVYPNYAFGAVPEESGTHTRNEDGDSSGVIGGWGLPDVLTDALTPDAS